MVHLTQVSTMLDLVAGLQSELESVGLFEQVKHGMTTSRFITPAPPMGVFETDETANESEFDAALRQCHEPGFNSRESNPPSSCTTACVLRASQSTKRSGKENRRLSKIAFKTQNDDVKLPSPVISSNKKSQEKDSNSSPSSAKRNGKKTDPSSVEGTSSVPNEKSDRKALNKPSATAKPAPSTSRRSSAHLATSPSPATAQRLFSARRKREMVKAKRKEVNENGETSLHVAARRGQWDRVQQLLGSGSRTNTKDFAGLTPLFDACGRGFEEVVRTLLFAGAHPNTPCGKDNDTPLHEAAFHGNIAVMELLLNHGANPGLENINGKTPLDMARHDNAKSFLSNFDFDSVRASVPPPVAATDENGSSPRPICAGRSDFLGSPLVGSRSSTANRKTRSSVGPPEPSLTLLDVASRDLSSVNRIVLLATGLNDDEASSKLLSDFAAEFHAEIVETFDKRVSHVICGAVDCDGNVTRTIKYLTGVVSGLKMVTSEWLSSSLRQKHLQPEELFLVRGSSKNPGCEGPRKSLLSHFYNFPPLFAGCHFFLDSTRKSFENPNEKDLAGLIEIAGGMILSRKPAWFDDGVGGTGAVSVPFHAQKCKVAKNVVYYVVNGGDVEGEGGYTEGDKENYDTGAGASDADRVRVKRSCPQLGWTTKSWLLDCFDRFEIIDSKDFIEEETFSSSNNVRGKIAEKSLEALRELQSTRISRSRDNGTEYLMAL